MLLAFLSAIISIRTFLWPILAYAVLLAVIFWLRREPRKGWVDWLLWPLIAVFFAVNTWWTIITGLPWVHGHVFEELRTMSDFMGLFLIPLELLAYLLPLGAAWLLRRFPNPATALKVTVIGVVGLVLLANTWFVVHLNQHRVAMESGIAATEVLASAGSQLGDKSPRSSDVILLDQAIAKMVGHLYVMIKNDFPELQVRSVSLHLTLPKQYPTKIWNVVQDGRESKDWEFLDRYRITKDGEPGSLISAAILGNARKYCGDVEQTVTDDCRYFQRPVQGLSLKYRSKIGRAHV